MISRGSSRSFSWRKILPLGFCIYLDWCWRPWQNLAFYHRFPPYKWLHSAILTPLVLTPWFDNPGWLVRGAGKIQSKKGCDLGLKPMTLKWGRSPTLLTSTDVTFDGAEARVYWGRLNYSIDRNLWKHFCTGSLLVLVQKRLASQISTASEQKRTGQKWFYKFISIE